ncbi:MAG: lytic transglycosylase domain-containing protein [Burkholderiales bacterium]|nr:lytic transglycosylase domain-containing protein [Burkholderiales bacterium]
MKAIFGHEFIGRDAMPKAFKTNEWQTSNPFLPIHGKLFVLIALMFAHQCVLADEFDGLAQRCAPDIPPDTLKALVKTESGFNPYAVGVVGKKVKQPKSFREAMALIADLELAGENYSVGIAQINKNNFARLGINAQKALDACENLRASAKVLKECYAQTKKEGMEGLDDALSCYYSGNFSTGRKHGYVAKVHGNAEPSPSNYAVPSITDSNIQLASAKANKSCLACGTNSRKGLLRGPGVADNSPETN